MPVITSNAVTSSSSLAHRLIPALGACVLGIALVWFAGFSPLEAVHNAAHDTRHSAAFPCH